MADRTVKVDFGFGDAVGWIAILALVILCSGEPDLLDAIAQNVRGCK